MKAITTKYIGPTNTRGPRIVAFDGDNRLSLPYNSSLNEDEMAARAAVALAKKMGWHGTLARGGTKAGYVFVWCDDQADQFEVERLDSESASQEAFRDAERIRKENGESLC